MMGGGQTIVHHFPPPQIFFISANFSGFEAQINYEIPKFSRLRRAFFVFIVINGKIIDFMPRLATLSANGGQYFVNIHEKSVTIQNYENKVA